MKIALDTKSKRHIDENGFLHVEISNISKECVSPYYGYEIPNYKQLGLHAESIYYAYRKGGELAKGAKTFNGLPLLRDHYIEHAENPQKEHRVGSLGTNAIFEAPYLKNSIIVTDAEAIRKIESRERVELSAAYAYTPLFEKGNFEGQEYDFIMTNIRGNHVALVEEGRVGNDVHVADSVSYKHLIIKEENMKEKKDEHDGSKEINADEEMLHVENKQENEQDKQDKQKVQVSEKEEAKNQIIVKINDDDDDLEEVQDMEDNVKIDDLDDLEGTDDLDDDDDSDEQSEIDNENNESDDSKEKNEDKSLFDEEFKEKLIEKLPYYIQSLRMLNELIKSLMALDKTQNENEEFNLLFEEDKALDSALAQKAKSAFKAEIKAELQEVQEAINICTPLVGELDVFAFDSANAVYLQACRLLELKANSASAKDVIHAFQQKPIEEKDIEKLENRVFRSRFQ